MSGHVFGDNLCGGDAIDGGRGGEDHLVDARVLHGGQHVGHATDVLLVVPGGARDGLADLLACGEVDDGRDVLVHHEVGENGTGFIGSDIEANQGRVPDPGRVGGGQVVDDDDAIPALTQEADNVCADVAGAATNENAHGFRIRRAAPSRLPARGLCCRASASLRDTLGESRPLCAGHVA